MKITKKLQHNNGITLIALVVTIIVLIILAGVSINLVLGDNGIITKAKQAKAKTEQAKLNEEIGLNQLAEYIENMGTTLIKNKNIGDYIDLGNDVVGTDSTTDDWRILYVDENKIYAILADYLPNSTRLYTQAGLGTAYTYGVLSPTDRDTLLNGLTSTTAWSSLANGINGAIVTGAPTGELLINSYNTKYNKSLTFSHTNLDPTDSLYIPHDSTKDECDGYWLASPNTNVTNYVFSVLCRDKIITSYPYNSSFLGVRPVVSLPSNIPVTQENGVWVVQH